MPENGLLHVVRLGVGGGGGVCMHGPHPTPYGVRIPASSIIVILFKEGGWANPAWICPCNS